MLALRIMVMVIATAYEAVKNIYHTEKSVQNWNQLSVNRNRVGCRPQKFKKDTKGLKELTPAVIDKLQNYFGIALRANCTTVETMQKAIWASFYTLLATKK